MEKLFDELNLFKTKKTISCIYIFNWKIRVTYHLDDKNSSYWEKSHYYNSSEVVDTSQIWELFELDYREKDLSDTLLLEQGYFLVWESSDFLPDYLKKFLIEYNDFILCDKLKVIKRSKSDKNLIYLKLNLFTKKHNELFSKEVKEILSKM